MSLALPLFIFFEPYTLTISLFERGLALHNFIAFLSFFTQWRGLIGSRGISPAKEMMANLRARGWTGRTRWKVLPTLCWWTGESDRALWAIQVVGLAASALAFLGVFSGLNILIAAACYSSIKCIGSVFTQLQMHAHIMEIDLLYVLVSPFLHVAPSSLVVLAGLLNFRIMMGGGAGKWFGGDKSWRDGTAMSFHYWTQPLPNPISAYMHRLPLWVHKIETYCGMVFESFAALFVFAPIWLRWIAFFGFVSLMLAINLTGNFAQISVLTINESILLLNDNVWNAFFRALSYVVPGVPYFQRWLLFAHSMPYADLAFKSSDDAFSIWDLSLGLVPWVFFILPYALIQIIPLVGTFRGHNALEIFDPYTDKPLKMYRQWIASDTYKTRVRPYWKKTWDLMEKGFEWGSIGDLFSSYVKFGHMTKFRREIIIEASLDGSEWKEYVFKYKPSRVTRKPPFFPLHYPAMDWRLWFLPLEAARGSQPPAWFMRILSRLLECEPTVMDLFADVPFDGIKTPKPKMIRAVLYDYRYAYKHEQEEEIKQIVKEYKIRDTTLNESSSEEEVEVEEAEKVAPKVEEDQLESSSEAKKETELTGEEKEVLHGGTKKPTTNVSSAPSPRASVRDGEESEEDDEGEIDEEDDRMRKQMLHIARLLNLDPRSLQLPGGGRRRRRRPRAGFMFRKKVARPVPQVDAEGNRVYYVRHRRVGPYGPTLTARPKRAEKANDVGDQDEVGTWEQFIDEDDE